jgi:hypothetical protein
MESRAFPQEGKSRELSGISHDCIRGNHYMDSGRSEFIVDRQYRSPKRILISAYKHASGEGSSNQVVLGQLIDRFGVHAIMNRPYLGVGEMIKITSAERIVRAYQMREEDENWVKWARKNPKDAEKFVLVEKMMMELEETDNG